MLGFCRLGHIYMIVQPIPFREEYFLVDTVETIESNSLKVQPYGNACFHEENVQQEFDLYFSELPIMLKVEYRIVGQHLSFSHNRARS